MADEDIVVRITADDTEILASFDNIREQAEELDSTVSGAGRSMEGAFNPTAVSGLADGIEDTNAAIVPLNTNVAKGSKGMGKFTRMGGRSVSMLGRMGGASGMAGGRIAGMGAMMAGTPFGAFIVLAGAAAIAVSMFGGSAAKEKKKIEELSESIDELNADIEKNIKTIKKQAVGLSDGTETEKAQARRKLAFDEQLKQEGLIRAATLKKRDANNAVLQVEKEIAVIKQLGLEDMLGGKEESILLKVREDYKKIENEIFEMAIKRNTAKKEVLAEDKKILKIAADKVKLSEADKKLAADTLKIEKQKALLLAQRISQAQDMFDALTRGELEAAEQTLKTQEKARQTAFRALEQGDTKNQEFKTKSEKVLQEDLTKLRTEYYQKQGEMRKAIELSFAVNERKIQEQNLQKELADSKKAISGLKQLEEETDAEFLQRKAEYTKLAEAKLISQIKAMKLAFKIEDTEKEQQAEDLLREAFLISERTRLIESGKTEDEITKILKEKLNERQKLQFESQKGLLELNLKDAEITDKDKEIIKAKIKKINAEIDAVGKEVSKEEGDGGLASMMGMTDNDLNNLKQLVDTSVSLVQKAVQERINALQKEVDFREKMVDEKQKNLETEMKLNELGKASNIQLAQKELKAEKEMRDKALRQKEEAARVQFAINTAMEASSLASAIAQLYASLSGQGMGVGVAIATGLSAVMIAAFIAAKTQAANASGFAEGGYTGDGGKYQPKGLVHGGEFVIDKETTSRLGLRHKSMSDFEDVIGGHMSDMPNMSAIGKRNRKYSSGLNAQIRQHKEQIYLSYEKGIKEALNGQNSILNGILQATKNTPIVFPMGDDKFLIERGKNKKEIKRIRK